MPRSTLLLSDIINRPWMFHPQFAVGYGRIVEKIINGELTPERTEATFSAFYDEKTTANLKSADKLPNGSVAIIDLYGVMLREDDWCTNGTESLSEYIYELADSPKIKGILIKTNSGGGAADSIAPLEQAITYAKAKKPVLAVGPLMASAAYWTACACDEIWLTESTGQVGSVGVMFSVQDVRPMWEAEGVKFHDVFADQSSEKNKAYLEVLKGNYTEIKEGTLNKMADEFIGAVKAARPDLGSDEKILQGKMYLAADALANGMIDRIGTQREAIAHIDTLAEKRGTATASASDGTAATVTGKETTDPKNNIDMKEYPLLLAMLELSELESKDGSAHLSEEQVEGLKSKVQAQFGEKLKIPSASIDSDGGYDIKPEGLAAMETQLAGLASEKLEQTSANEEELAKLKAENAQQQAGLKERDEKIVKLSASPEGMKLPETKGGAENHADETMKELEKFNASDRAWNAVLLKMQSGEEQQASAMMVHMETDTNLKKLMADMADYTAGYGASDNLNLEKVNDELGNHRQVNTKITVRDETAHAADRIESLFPALSTGIQNEYSEISMYIKEFMQPRNGQWAEKGGFSFDAETITVNEWQVSHSFTAREIWQFTRTWLTRMTKGDHPYQMPLVAFLSREMLRHIRNVERPRVMIKGVYRKPEDGKAGQLMHSMSGLLHSVQQRIRQLRILPTFVGKGNYEIHNPATGLLNKNHYFYKVEAVYKSIPVQMREAFQLVCYCNMEDKAMYKRFLVQGIAKDPNHAKQEKDAVIDNLRLEEVPFWPKGLIIITVPNNFVRCYRERGDDNRITMEKFKRDMHVWMDGAGKVSPIYSGQKYGTFEELLAAERTTQAIFTNAEFSAYTPLELKADVTKPDMKVHNVLVTAENTQATAITELENAVAGSTVYLIGGSDKNASTIAENAAKFVGIPKGGLTFTTGKKAKFKVSKDGKKYTLLSHWSEESEGTLVFEPDATTPSLEGSYSFLTSPENSKATAITDFGDAETEVEYTIHGGGGTNPTTIAKSGKFSAISADWKGEEGKSITLSKRADGTWVEII